MSMKDKVILVTGAAQGIGEAIAVKFAEEGAKIAIFDLIEPKKTINKIEKIGAEAIWMPVDITDDIVIKNSIDEIVLKWNEIDVLVNNAGIFPIERFDKISIGLFRKVFEINVIGTFICSQCIVNLFISKNIVGNIINIASVGGIREEIYHSHYNASKAAIISLTKSMALELARYKIRVNAVAPGAIMTKGAKTAVPFPESGQFPEDFMEFQKRKFSPLGKMGDPEDIANIVLYLASDKAEYITGAVFVVDGGRTLL